MFEKFGEMDTDGINTLAENLFNEGDLDSLRALAKENGIDEDSVEDYLNGETPYLTNLYTAAMGRLDIQAEELKPKDIMEDWVDYIRTLCMDHPSVARAIMSPDTSLEGCIAEILKWSFGHQHQIPDKIRKAAGVKAGKVTLGIPGMGQAKKLIRKYYGGGK